MSAARGLEELLQTRYLTRGKSLLSFSQTASPWSFAALQGRLVSLLPSPAPAKLMSNAMAASLSAVFQVVLDAQKNLETVAWVGGEKSCFYPPDAARWGVDLHAMAVIRLQSDKDIWFAADTLIRSGGVGMVIIDLASLEKGQVSRGTVTKGVAALQHRLAGLARTHQTAVLILPGKEKREEGGAMVSLTVQTQMVPLDSRVGAYNVLVAPKKDKTGTSNWKIEELCDAPDGLC